MRAIHHVAYACRDVEATRHFYEDLLGFPLVHTELARNRGGWFRHLFFDLGDGSCLAFFDLHGAGEQPGWSSEVSSGNGLPVWVNHIAFAATEERQAEVRKRLGEAGIAPHNELDHVWCHSLYFIDPNGIMIEFCRDTPGFTPEPEKARAQLSATLDVDAGTSEG